MKVLVTGGAGYIGTELIHKLLKHDEIESITIYDNFYRKNFNLFTGQKTIDKKRVKVIDGDLLDSRNLSKALAGIDSVIHLAAIVSTPLADQHAHMYEQINHWGCAELANAVEKSQVKNLIYLSSVSVYGSSEKEIDISTIPNPKSFYGTSKLRGEKHFERLSPKVNTMIVRCGNVYGFSPSMRFDAVINQFMFNAHHKDQIIINGDGQQKRTFISVDKVSAYLTNAIKTRSSDLTVNLCDRVLTINEVAETVSEIYPDLEIISVNQHLNLSGISVKKEAFVEDLPGIKNLSFKEELENFKAKFSMN